MRKDDLANAVRCGIAEAARKGWVTVDTGECVEAIAAAVWSIGTPRTSRTLEPGLERLTPRLPREAPRRSLSAVHGLGAFPFHTDGAHWPVPPRWVIMWCEDSDNDRPTLLMHWRDVLAASRDTGPATFLVRNGRWSHFAVVHGHARFDAGCMSPQNKSARSIVDALDHAQPQIPNESHKWIQGQALILDNQAVLHARDFGNDLLRDRGRVLHRAIIQEAVLP